MSLALTGLVLGGNVPSIVLLAMMPPELLGECSGIVLTSVMTSAGLVVFCLHDLVVDAARGAAIRRLHRG